MFSAFCLNSDLIMWQQRPKQPEKVDAFDWHRDGNRFV